MILVAFTFHVYHLIIVKMVAYISGYLIITGVQPMFQVFQQYPGVLESDEAKKIIRSYNKVAKVLLEYEVIYHQAWLKQVSYLYNLPSGLAQTGLVFI